MLIYVILCDLGARHTVVIGYALHTHATQTCSQIRCSAIFVKILFGSHRQTAPHNLYRFFLLKGLYDLNIDTYDICFIQGEM